MTQPQFEPVSSGISASSAPRLIPTTEMFARLCYAKSAGHARINSGLLPRPLPHNGRKSVVPEHEVSEIVLATIRGASEDELRDLVTQMQKTRQNRGAA